MRTIHRKKKPKILRIFREIPSLYSNDPFYSHAVIMGDWSDLRSLQLLGVDFSKVSFECCVNGGEVINGRVKLTRHKEARHICLDAGIGESLLLEENKNMLEWLYKVYDVPWFEFPGTVFCDIIVGRPFFLALRRGGTKTWKLDRAWLDCDRTEETPSIVIIMN